jgi:predicted secreted protein
VLISSLLDNTTILSLSESWGRTCTVMNDTPLSGAYWHIEEMSGEQYLEELPELQLSEEQFYTGLN